MKTSFLTTLSKTKKIKGLGTRCSSNWVPDTEKTLCTRRERRHREERKGCTAQSKNQRRTEGSNLKCLEMSYR